MYFVDIRRHFQGSASTTVRIVDVDELLCAARCLQLVTVAYAAVSSRSTPASARVGHKAMKA